MKNALKKNITQLLRKYSKKVGIIGCPIDLGAGKRGVDMGPFSIRHAQIHEKLSQAGYETTDYGNINVPTNKQDIGDPKARYFATIEPIMKALSKKTEEIYLEGEIPITLGGDHSVAAGSLSGVQRAARKKGELELGLLWIDAHTDFNTPETSPSGNLHGMSAAALCGLNVKGLSSSVGQYGLFNPIRTCFIGIRDVDELEKANLEQLGFKMGVNVFTMSEIDDLGISEVVRRALVRCAPSGAPFALSIDLDALDPREAPGVGTPVPGGLTYREGHFLMEMCAKHGGMRAIDLVEVNPILDERNKTAEMAVDLLLSALGKSIIN